jgi:hypothetical protein
LDYFKANRTRRPEPDWSLAPIETAARQQALARSLAHFQLGESGEGRCLIREGWKYARQHSDPAYGEALELFVGEEQEHARLLEGLVKRFGGKTIRHHWTHALFRVVRQLFGLHFELQVLVIAELVGTAYYRLLQQQTSDPVLRQICELILRDEERHVEFHLYRLGLWQQTCLPMERELWKGQFQVLFLAALQVAWTDHRSCLELLGSTRELFRQEARNECIRFLDGFQAQENRSVLLSS